MNFESYELVISLVLGIAIAATGIFTYCLTSNFWRSEYQTVQMLDVDGHVYIYSREFPVQHIKNCSKCAKP